MDKDRTFLMFYSNVESFGHVWLYGEDDLKKEVKSCEEKWNVEILQVIEVFDYKEIHVDDILEGR